MNDPAMLEMLDDIEMEVARARAKFPECEKLLAALGEEVGEVCRCFLQRRPDEEKRRELVQVIAVCVRLIEEGDSDFTGEGWSGKP